MVDDKHINVTVLMVIRSANNANNKVKIVSTTLW